VTEVLNVNYQSWLEIDFPQEKKAGNYLNKKMTQHGLSCRKQPPPVSDHSGMIYFWVVACYTISGKPIICMFGIHHENKGAH